MLARLARSGAVAVMAAGLVFVVPGGPVQAAGENALIETAVQGLRLVASDGILTSGAVTAALPEAVVACTGPQVVGCVAISAAIAGVALYATRDIWMPWVTNAFGDGGPGSEIRSPGSPWVMLPFEVDPAPGGVWSVTASVTSGQGPAFEQVSVRCRVAGVDSTVTTGLANIGSWGSVGHTLSGQCGQMGTLQALQTIGGGAQMGEAANQVSWGAGFDPATESTVNTTVDCVKPDGTTGTVSVATINPDGGVLVPSCVAAFGPGSHGTKIGLDGGQTGQPSQPMTSITVPTTSVLYPNCVGAGVGCTYVVKFRGTPCVVGAPDCIDWALRSQVDGNTDYTCFYGPYSMPLAGCALDERAYENTPHRLTRLNTDGNPMTWDGPRPSWQTDPNVSGDPSAPPVAVPGFPATSVIPGVGIHPGTPPMPAPPPVGASPNESTDCWGGGTVGWNPAEWVLRPVKCALQWAFVPSSSYLHGWGDSINAEWTGSPFGTWLNTLGSLGAMPIVSAGCAGPALSTGFMSDLPGHPIAATIHPFDACSPPMSTVAATSYMILTAGIAFYGGMKIIRQLGFAFGFQIHVGSERSTFT